MCVDEPPTKKNDRRKCKGVVPPKSAGREGREGGKQNTPTVGAPKKAIRACGSGTAESSNPRQIRKALQQVPCGARLLFWRVFVCLPRRGGGEDDEAPA